MACFGAWALHATVGAPLAPPTPRLRGIPARTGTLPPVTPTPPQTGTRSWIDELDLGRPGVVVCVGPPSVTAQQIAAQHPDLHVLWPAGDRWTVADAATVTDTANRFAHHEIGVNRIFVGRADMIPPTVWPKLLKVLEEPLAPTVFVLSADTDETLPDPVRGRLDRIVTVPAPSTPERLAALEAAGWPAAVAAHVVAATPAGLLDTVASSAVRDALATLAAVTGTPPIGCSPQAMFAAADAVAAATISGKTASGRTGTIRDILRHNARRWAQTAPLAGRDLSATDVAILNRRVDACRQLTADLDHGVPPLLAIYAWQRHLVAQPQ